MINQFRQFANAHAWPLSLVIVGAYFLYFALPAAFHSESLGTGSGLHGVEKLNAQLSTEVLLAASVLIVIAVLGWFRQSGFRRVEPGGLKFAIGPLIFTALLLGIVAVMARSSGTSIFEIIGIRHLAILILVTLLIGVYEEALFRGILLKGASTRFSILGAVMVSSVIFGLMHIVNFIDGQPLPETVIQIIHAAIGGFMYGMLRLRIGALWPVILLHGFWDMAVSVIVDTIPGISGVVVDTAAAAAPNEQYSVGAFVMMAPELLYGLFLVWIYKRWTAKTDVLN